MDVKRVLVCGFTENQGGMESYIMAIYRCCDRTKLQFDFLNFHTFPIAYADEIKELGGEIYYIPMKSVDYKGHFDALEDVFSHNQYAAVYYQCMHKLVSADVFQYAKKYDVPKIVMHAHTTKSGQESLMHRIREFWVEMNLPRYVTDRFACSKEAGEWLFGDKKFEIIKNSIDTKVFYYNPKAREQIRKELGISDKFVIGTVGRLAEVKNTGFIMDSFQKLHEKCPNAVFLHVGGGPLMEELCVRRKDKDLEDVYFLTGAKNNIADYMNAMDVFVLPSLQEGFPIVLLEAQATGLHCVIADHITSTCDLTGNISFVSIEHGVQPWVEEILKCLKKERKTQVDKIKSAGYDVQVVSKQIEDFFISS